MDRKTEHLQKQYRTTNKTIIQLNNINKLHNNTKNNRITRPNERTIDGMRD